MKQDVDSDAVAIGAAYRKGREGLRDCGLMLIEKKKKMEHGEWLPWLEANSQVLGFNSERTAQKLMAFANAPLTSDLWGNDNHRAIGTGENEWFTPAEWIERARTVLGTIDLDPASCPAAQSIVRATTFFTKAQNGLKRDWHGKVWLNPPYAQPDIEQFALKAVAELRNNRIEAALILTHNYTDTVWFQVLADAAIYVAFPSGRIRFVDANGERCSPTQGQAIFCLGNDDGVHERFADQFGEVGLVMVSEVTK